MSISFECMLERCIYTDMHNICLFYFDGSVPRAFVFQVEMFRAEKAKLDMEVAKWDDSGNDIIVMAKQMCMIMMEMTDFTRSACVLFPCLSVDGVRQAYITSVHCFPTLAVINTYCSFLTGLCCVLLFVVVAVVFPQQNSCVHHLLYAAVH